MKTMLVSRKPDNISGPRSANRFEYQKDWAISLLLNLYNTRTDFLVILDYHDDLAVVDSELCPSKCCFYQVKTKDSGVWKTSDLISTSNGRSFLAKLYEHRLNFGDAADMLIFLSNCKIDRKMLQQGVKNEHERIDTTLLTPSVVNRIQAAIKKELSLPIPPVFGKLLIFEYSDLSVTDHATHVKGKISDFLKERELNGNLDSLYRALIDEIRRKTDYEFVVDNWESFKNNKTLGYEKFDKFIKAATITDHYDQTLAIAFQQLTNENMNFMTIKNLITRSRSIRLELFYDDFLDLQATRELVQDYIRSLKKDAIEATLSEYLENRVAEIKPLIAPIHLSDEISLMLFVLEAFYEIT